MLLVSPALSTLTFQELMTLPSLITSVASLITTVAELISAAISRRDSWQGKNTIVAMLQIGAHNVLSPQSLPVFWDLFYLTRASKAPTSRFQPAPLTSKGCGKV